ncbi:hypothetical protein ACA910_005061 [Epithemia clementina (nom. ined.)]
MSTATLSNPVQNDNGVELANKRKNDEDPKDAVANKMMKTAGGSSSDEPKKPTQPKVNPRAREIRLEQNRKAARESRRRKKVMIEELQRSVIFFSRANGTLKQQSEELTRFLMQAQMQIAAIESHKGTTSTLTNSSSSASGKAQDIKEDLNLEQANIIATQAMYESKGFPAAAARAAAQAIGGNPKLSTSTMEAKETTKSPPSIPPMEPGATMQAMANFQQAAAVAMQSAMGQMQNVLGVSLSQLSAVPAGTNAQQAYTDTMTALAMQQAAAAAAAGMMHPGMQFLQPLLPHWQQQQLQLQEASSRQDEKADTSKDVKKEE